MAHAEEAQALAVARSFGTVLRRRRDGLALSQERLAEAAGLDRTYVSMLERGVHQPSLAVFVRVAKALDVSASELMVEVADELSASSHVNEARG